MAHARPPSSLVGQVSIPAESLVVMEIRLINLCVLGDPLRFKNCRERDEDAQWRENRKR